MSTPKDAEKARYEKAARKGASQAADSLRDLSEALYQVQGLAKERGDQAGYRLACEAIDKMVVAHLSVGLVRAAHERLS